MAVKFPAYAQRKINRETFTRTVRANTTAIEFGSGNSQVVRDFPTRYVEETFEIYLNFAEAQEFTTWVQSVGAEFFDYEIPENYTYNDNNPNNKRYERARFIEPPIPTVPVTANAEDEWFVSVGLFYAERRTDIGNGAFAFTSSQMTNFQSLGGWDSITVGSGDPFAGNFYLANDFNTNTSTLTISHTNADRPNAITRDNPFQAGQTIRLDRGIPEDIVITAVDNRTNYSVLTLESTSSAYRPAFSFTISTSNAMAPVNEMTALPNTNRNLAITSPTTGNLPYYDSATKEILFNLATNGNFGIERRFASGLLMFELSVKNDGNFPSTGITEVCQLGSTPLNTDYKLGSVYFDYANNQLRIPARETAVSGVGMGITTLTRDFNMVGGTGKARLGAFFSPKGVYWTVLDSNEERETGTLHNTGLVITELRDTIGFGPFNTPATATNADMKINVSKVLLLYRDGVNVNNVPLNIRRDDTDTFYGFPKTQF